MSEPPVLPEKQPMKNILASKRGVETVVGLLFFMGAMCPKCGFGTRVTSKKWSKCKRCGERVERRALPEVHRAANKQTSDANPTGQDPK